MNVVFNSFSAEHVASGGRGLTLWFGMAHSPVGECFVSWCLRGICSLEFAGDRDACLERLSRQWPAADLAEDGSGARRIVESVFAGSEVQVCLHATDFRLRVWRALVSVPFGHTASYSQLAEMAGFPRAVRATASAVGANRLGYIIPCHRIVRSDGSLGGFFWGLPVKRRMLDWERERGAENRECYG